MIIEILSSAFDKNIHIKHKNVNILLMTHIKTKIIINYNIYVLLGTSYIIIFHIYVLQRPTSTVTISFTKKFKSKTCRLYFTALFTILRIR